MAAARRARQASRADAPRVAKRVARARDEEPSSRNIQVRDRCHGRAVRTRREERSMACYRHARTRRRSGVAGHMAQGGRLRAIAWVRATYQRCRSWNAAAPRALSSQSPHAWHVGDRKAVSHAGRVAIARGRPIFFCARRKLLLSDHINESKHPPSCASAPLRQGGWWGVTRGLLKMGLPRPSPKMTLHRV